MAVFAALTFTLAEGTFVAQVDAHVRRHVLDLRMAHPQVIWMSRAGALLGQRGVMLPALILLILGTCRFGRPLVFRGAGGSWLPERRSEASRPARDRDLVRIVAVLLTGSLMTELVKVTCSRPAPRSGLSPRLGVEGSSYPSGHVVLAAVTWWAVAVLVMPRSVRFTQLSVGAAAAWTTGVSMVVADFHWASDVLGGWLMSAALLLATATETPRMDAGLDSSRHVEAARRH